MRGQGGNPEILGQWLDTLVFEEQYWQGMLKGEPQEFLGSLRLMGGQLLSLNLYRPSLEQFFVEELRQRNIQPSE